MNSELRTINSKLRILLRYCATALLLYCTTALSFLLLTSLYAAVIESVTYDPKTLQNIIVLYPEQPPPGATTIYRVWFSSGGVYSINNWESLPPTTAITIRHYIGDRLGDFRYCAQHSFDGGATWIPDTDPPPWTGRNPPPATFMVAPYVHHIERGCYTDNKSEESQLGMGQMWFFRYQLLDDSYVHIRIYPSSTTPTSYTNYGFPKTISSTYTIRTLIHKVPRSGEMIDSSWWNTDEWDCRDDAGNVVPNGIYVVSIDAYDKHWRPYDPSDTNPPLTDTSSYPKVGRRGWAWFTIPVDIIRIMKFYANPLVDYVGEKTFTYRLTAAAHVKIKVYRDAPTFAGIDTNPASDTYGEPIPSDATKLIKTLKFYRTAGNWEEQWDGSWVDPADGKTKFLPDGIYTYSISAVNDYKRIATDMFGNDRPMFGNVTIMRTAPPSNAEAGTAGGTGNITIKTYAPSRGAKINSTLSSVVIGVPREAEITASNSYINITTPDNREVKGVISVSGDMVIAQFPPLTKDGTYTVDMKLADLKNRNWWIEKYTFAIARKSISFAESVYAYPNPAKDEIKFAFQSGNSGKIRIRNVLGEVVRDEVLTSSPHPMKIDNLGNGIYFYTVEVDGKEATKPFIIAK